MQFCDENAGLLTSHKDRTRHVTQAYFPSTHLTSKELPLKESEWIKGDNGSHKNDRIRESIKRWHHIISKNSARRQLELSEKHISSEKEIHGAVAGWSSGTLPNTSTPLLADILMNGPRPTVTYFFFCVNL